MLGASIAYAIGYFGSSELLERQGSKLHVSRRGSSSPTGGSSATAIRSIFFSRFIPVVRAAFPYAAGVAEMPFWRFFILATLGSIPWIVGLAVLGKAVGQQLAELAPQPRVRRLRGAAILVGVIVYLIVRRSRGGGGGPAPDVAS